MLKKYKVKCRYKVCDDTYQTEIKMFTFYRKAIKEYERKMRDETTQYVIVDKYNKNTMQFDIPLCKYTKGQVRIGVERQ